jgi:hypothetical protein
MVVTQHEDGLCVKPDLTVAQASETVKVGGIALFDFRTSAHYSKRLFVLGKR